MTDGLETCDGDPCAEAARLAEQGLTIRAHVVGFGLTDSEIQQLSCVTEQTGGELFQTNSGAELASALSQVEQAAAEPVPEPEPEPEPEPAPPPAAELTAPDEAPAGSVIEVSWTGPDDDKDYVTIVEAGAPEGSYTDYTRTSRGSPLTITSQDALGNFEIRYVHQQSGETLASHPITLTQVEASLSASDETVTGSVIEVEWEGPDNPKDYITIVEAGAPEGSYTDYVRTSRGSSVTLDAPAEPGEYEVRYVIQQSGRTLASEPVSVGAGEVSLAIGGSPEVGGVVTVNWQGPGRYEDYIQIVEAGSAPDGAAIREARASQGSPLQLFAPASAGSYEIRYKASDSGEVLESLPFILE
ncbi:MAG: hypothetical protein ABR580_10340 [Halomonas sp.]